MRILAALSVIAPLLLIGALPAAAAPPDQSAANTPAADRDAYSREMHAKMEEWQRKLHTFNAKAEAEGQDETKATQHELSEAWSRADVASRQLETAAAENWEDARVSFEVAFHELAERWRKAHPENKQ